MVRNERPKPYNPKFEVIEKPWKDVLMEKIEVFKLGIPSYAGACSPTAPSTTTVNSICICMGGGKENQKMGEALSVAAARGRGGGPHSARSLP